MMDVIGMAVAKIDESASGGEFFFFFVLCKRKVAH